MQRIGIIGVGPAEAVTGSDAVFTIGMRASEASPGTRA
jgi:hypothetical protein